MGPWSRRDALIGIVAASGLASLAGSGAYQRKKNLLELGAPLPPWRPGTLDIHHLGYGRGDSTLLIMPNGASILIDAGAVTGNDPALVQAPHGMGSDPGAWIARYARRQLEPTGKQSLDAAIVTHLHVDHVGQMRRPPFPFPAKGSHVATGISSVAERLQIETLYDPDWPHYGYPAFEGQLSIENYVAFLRNRVAKGGNVEKLEVGNKIDLGGDSDWSLRTVASRGRVWTGADETALDIFPSRGDLAREDWPNENAMSAGFLASFGSFKYFAGGDLTDWADAGTKAWMNALTPTAQAIGPVHVSTVPHHGMFDAASTDTVRALAARDWVIMAWHAAHPSLSTLERLFNQRIYPGPRDVFSTALHQAADRSMKRLIDRFASRRGNVICRVTDRGMSYRMIATDQDSTSGTVTYLSEPRHLGQNSS